MCDKTSDDALVWLMQGAGVAKVLKMVSVRIYCSITLILFKGCVTWLVQQ